MKKFFWLMIFVVFALALTACESTPEINSNDVVVPNSNSDPNSGSNTANADEPKNVANDNADSTPGQTASNKETEKTPVPAQKPKKEATPTPPQKPKTEVKPTPAPTQKPVPRPTRRKPAPKKTPWQGKSDADRSGNQNN